MVSVHMGVDDVGDFHVLFGGFVDEPLFVAEHRVDGDADMAGTAPKKVGQGGVFGQ
jgi:hypothetical protein